MDKICARCKLPHPLDNFYQNKVTGYYAAYCKACQKEKYKQYVEQNKEGIMFYQRLYQREYRKYYCAREDVKEKRREREKLRRDKNNAYQKKYYEKNRERILERMNFYRKQKKAV